MKKPYQLISRDTSPGRNGKLDIRLLVRVKKLYYRILLHPEYFRFNKEGAQEQIYRCTVYRIPMGYRLYSGFEHPDSAVEHFLRKAGVLK